MKKNLLTTVLVGINVLTIFGGMFVIGHYNKEKNEKVRECRELRCEVEQLKQDYNVLSYEYNTAKIDHHELEQEIQNMMDGKPYSFIIKVDDGFVRYEKENAKSKPFKTTYR